MMDPPHIFLPLLPNPWRLSRHLVECCMENLVDISELEAPLNE